MALQPQVICEDAVFSLSVCDSGAGPLWCYGNTLIVRAGDDVFISGVERIADSKPLHTLRWVLYKRTNCGWEKVQQDDTERQREPCPIAQLDGGRLMMSVNPSLVPHEYEGPSRPEVLEFDMAKPDTPPRAHVAQWRGEPPFCEHSYRSFAVDRERGEMLLMHNIGYTHAEWSLCDADGAWAHAGRIIWPWGHEYDKPHPVRICYPAVALRNRAAYVFGTSDIAEPYGAWADYREELGLPREYDFRRVFFTWTDDIAAQPFRPWVELGTRDKTAGKMRATDVHIDAEGRAHLLWIEKALDENLRDTFFPDARQWYALNYAVVEPDGKIQHTHLHYCNEKEPRREPTAARFHMTADGRLLVVYHLDSDDEAAGNYITELTGNFLFTDPMRIALKTPLHSFMTATPRAGNAGSNTLDMMGATAHAPLSVHYAQVRV